MGLDISKVQAICFDVDGTLSDTDDMWVSRITKATLPFKFLSPKSESQHFARWLIMAMESPGNVVYEALDWTHLDDDVARIYNSLAQRGHGRKPKQFWVIPGVLEMLSIFHHRYPLAVVSARDELTTHQFLNQFGIRDLFKSVITAQTCVYTKPFPDPILLAASHANVLPQECLMVGDTTVDIRAGKAAGAQTVGVLCGFGTERELRRAGADIILKNTGDLLELFL
jgi:phosphoglycolate phosphatase-like HAD superfamily hydrolase